MAVAVVYELLGTSNLLYFVPVQQVGIGIGTLEENAEGVISSLSNITNQTETMRTFANMNFSVDVLSILSKKEVQVNQEMTVEVSTLSNA